MRKKQLVMKLNETLESSARDDSSSSNGEDAIHIQCSNETIFASPNAISDHSVLLGVWGSTN